MKLTKFSKTKKDRAASYSPGSASSSYQPSSSPSGNGGSFRGGRLWGNEWNGGELNDTIHVVGDIHAQVYTEQGNDGYSYSYGGNITAYKSMFLPYPNSTGPITELAPLIAGLSGRIGTLEASAGQGLPGSIIYNQVKEYLRAHNQELMREHSTHIFQIVNSASDNARNLGMLFVVGDTSGTTLSLLLYTHMMVSGPDITNSYRNPNEGGAGIYKSEYANATDYMANWQEIAPQQVQVEPSIPYNGIQEYLKEHSAELARTAVPHIFQLVSGTRNVGTLTVTGNFSTTTLDLLLFTRCIVSGTTLNPNSYRNPDVGGVGLYKSSYTYATDYFENWQEFIVDVSALTLLASRLRMWTGIPDSFDDVEETLYDMAVRKIEVSDMADLQYYALHNYSKLTGREYTADVGGVMCSVKFYTRAGRASVSVFILIEIFGHTIGANGDFLQTTDNIVRRYASNANTTAGTWSDWALVDSVTL